MKRKEYRRPQMKVVELRQTGMLMLSNGKGLTNPSNYDDGGDPFAEPSGE